MSASTANKFLGVAFNYLKNNNSHATFLQGSLSHSQPIRFASKTSGGVSRNKRKRTIAKNRGFKVQDGEYVRTGAILCTQLQLRYYPGENVSIGRNMNLNAKEDGKVVMSVERLSPYPDSPIFPGVQKGEIIERIFINVVPEPQHTMFTLTSLV